MYWKRETGNKKRETQEKKAMVMYTLLCPYCGGEASTAGKIYHHSDCPLVENNMVRVRFIVKPEPCIEPELPVELLGWGTKEWRAAIWAAINDLGDFISLYGEAALGGNREDDGGLEELDAPEKDNSASAGEKAGTETGTAESGKKNEKNDSESDDKETDGACHCWYCSGGKKTESSAETETETESDTEEAAARGKSGEYVGGDSYARRMLNAWKILTGDESRVKSESGQTYYPGDNIWYANYGDEGVKEGDNEGESGADETETETKEGEPWCADYEGLYYTSQARVRELEKKVKKLKKKVSRLKKWGHGYMDKCDELKEYATRSVSYVGRPLEPVVPTESTPDKEYYQFLGQCPNCGAEPIKWWEAFDNNKMECQECHFVLLFDDNGNTSEPHCGQCGTEKFVNANGDIICPECEE